MQISVHTFYRVSKYICIVTVIDPSVTLVEG